MNTRLFIVLITFMAIGSYSKGQDLRRKECANGKYGFTDHTGREVIPCKYDHAWNFNEGLAAVPLNGKEMYIE
jgi:hypothetical protein